MPSRKQRITIMAVVSILAALLAACGNATTTGNTSTTTTSGGGTAAVRPLFFADSQNKNLLVVNPNTGATTATINYDARVVCFDKMHTTLYMGNTRLAAFSNKGNKLWETAIIPNAITTLGCFNDRLIVFSEKQLTGYTLDGKQTWQQQLSTFTSQQGVVITPSAILLESEDANGQVSITFVDPETGQTLSSFPTGIFNYDASNTKGYYIASFQDLIMLTLGGNLIGVQSKSGQKVWQTQSPTTPTPRICADANAFYTVDSSFSKLEAITGASGTTLWSYQTAGDTVTGANCWSDGTHIIGAGGDEIFALDAHSGQETWHAQNPTNSSPLNVTGSIDRGKEALFAANGTFAFDLTTGKQIWRSSTRVIWTEGGLGFGFNSSGYTALNTTTGKDLWSQPVPEGAYSSINLVTDTMALPQAYLIA